MTTSCSEEAVPDRAPRRRAVPSYFLLAQDAVLLLEVLDDLTLAAVHPAGEHQQQELKGRT
jgi:hypothetical protein